MTVLKLLRKLSKWNLNWPDEDIHKTGTGDYSGMENRFPVPDIEIEKVNVFGDAVEDSDQLVRWVDDGYNSHMTSVTPKAHRLVLDIDHPAALIASSTPGHSHLVVDTVIPHDKWEALMTALADAGVIEEGYAAASLHRKQAFIRAPWAPKSMTIPPYRWNEDRTDIIMNDTARRHAL